MKMILSTFGLALATAACGTPAPTAASAHIWDRIRVDASTASDIGGQDDRQDMRANRDALLAADAALSSAVGERGLLDGLVPALADDAHYLQPGHPLMRGRETVRAFMQGRPSTAALRFAWRAIRADVSADGTLGYTFGYGTYAPAGTDGTPPSGLGGYIVAWRKAADGAWQVAGFVRNNSQANLAAAPAGYESPDYRNYRAFPHPDAEGARAAVERTDIEFSDYTIANGTAAGFSRYAAPDGALLSGAFGPDAIRASFAGAPATSGGGWRPVHTEVATTGDFGFTVGTAEFRSIVDGVERSSYSKYISVWKRQRTGEWRYVLDGGNASPAL